jgi:hypothetical protein
MFKCYSDHLQFHKVNKFSMPLHDIHMYFGQFKGKRPQPLHFRIQYILQNVDRLLFTLNLKF